MHYKIHVIEQYPVSLVIALYLIRRYAAALEAQFDFVCNRLNLSGVLSTADNEIIGKCRRILVHFEDPDVLAFLFFTGLHCRGYLSSDCGIH